MDTVNEPRRADLDQLMDVLRDVVGESSAAALVQRLARGTRELGGADAAILWELERDGRALVPAAWDGISAEMAAGLHGAAGEGPVGAAASSREPREGEFEAEPYRQAKLVSGLAMPLVAKGELVGVLLAARRDARPFTNEARRLLTTLAAYAASLLATNRLYWQAVGARRSLTQLHDIARDAVESLGSPTLLKRIVRGAAEVAHSERAMLWTLDAAGREFVPTAWHGVDDAEASALRLRVDEGTLGEVLRRRAPVEADLKSDPRVPDPDVVARRGLRGSVRVPVLLGAEVRGVLGVATVKNRRYTIEEIEALSTLAAYAASALETAKTYRAALEAQAAWTATVEAVEDMALIASPDGIVRRANQALHRRLGATAGSLAGRHVADVFGLAKDAREPAPLALSGHASTSFEGEVPRFPGARFRIQASPIQTEGGTMLGTVVVLRELAGPPTGRAGGRNPSTSKFATPRGRRVLVVDAERGSAEFVRRVLGESNTIVAAEDGARAVAVLRAERFDVVIADMRMPGLSGRELFRLIARERPELTNRVIFATSSVPSEDTGEYLRTLEITMVTKPFAARDVLSAVLQTLNEPA
jgi:GAF domain-containing protein/ActR/RegA family two-component response regulator